MKQEDLASVKLVNDGTIGKVVFFRYSLTIPKRKKTTHIKVLNEVFDWIKGCQVTDIETLSASYTENKQVLLLTIQFVDNVMGNIFINCDDSSMNFVKKMEIAGTEGLYVFDSSNETAFVSDFLPRADYQLSESINPNHKTWFELIKKSLETKDVIEMGEI